MKTGTLMAAQSDWLDANVTLTETSGNTLGYVQTTTACRDYWPNSYTVYPCYPYYPVYQSSPARPIKLTLSEVERLRKAAKADDKLKAILQKFTSQIEITVDFE